MSGLITTFQDKGLYHSVHKLSSEQYSKQCRATNETLPIIIDNGSYQTRAGWSLDHDPRLIFRSLVGRPKTRKGGDFLLVGDQIGESDYFNLKTKSPFDNNVVNNFELMEYLLDYTFAGLGLGRSNSIEHPILMTESVCNPNYSRAHMSELLFECYRVPAILYGVDSLFSLFYNQQQPDLGAFSSSPSSSLPQHALVVSSSFENTHIYPVINQRPDFSHCTRIPVGGQTSQQMVLQALQTIYPQHKHQITVFRAQELVETYSSMVPEDYGEELNRLEEYEIIKKEQEKKNSLNRKTLPTSITSLHLLNKPPLVTPIKLQLPFVVQEPKPAETDADLKLKAEKKIQNQQRLRKLAAERREKKLEKRRENLENCEALKKQRDSGEIDKAEFEIQLKEGGFEDEADFLKVIKDLKKRIEKDEKTQKEKEAKENKDGGGGEEDEEDKDVKSDSELYPLLNIPDEKLTPEQNKEKKKQRFLKNAAAGRARKKAEKDARKEIEKQEKEEEDRKRLADPIGWLAAIHTQRNKILENRTRRQKSRAEAASRRVLSKKRMHLLAKTFKDEEGSFGDDSSDWQVYRSLQDAGGGGDDSDSEEEKRQLAKYEALIKEHDKDSFKKEEKTNPANDATNYQLDYYVHRIAAPELVFQPQLIGCSEAGLAESLNRLLNGLDKSLQDLVVQNVFVCGGNTKYPNFSQRLINELTAIRPFKSAIKVTTAKDQIFDAWRGARLYAQQCARSNNWEEWMTLTEYQEKGAEYLHEHRMSNTYIPSPIPPPTPIPSPSLSSQPSSLLSPTSTTSLSGIPSLSSISSSPNLSASATSSVPVPVPISLSKSQRSTTTAKRVDLKIKVKKEKPSNPTPSRSTRQNNKQQQSSTPSKSKLKPPLPPKQPTSPGLVYTSSRSVADIDFDEDLGDDDDIDDPLPTNIDEEDEEISSSSSKKNTKAKNTKKPISSTTKNKKGTTTKTVNKKKRGASSPGHENGKKQKVKR